MSEAEHLMEIYSDMDGDYDAYHIAEMQYKKMHTMAILAGIDTKPKRIKNKAKELEDLFVIIQDSRKDDTTLMLVDRRKSKKYWWTHDFSIAYKDTKENMIKVASKLKKNNVRVISYNEYFNQI